MMENGVQNGIATNHDRNSNGAHASQPAASAQPNGAAMANGANTGTSNPRRMNDLPDEILHISDGFIPVADILSKLAQKTHNQLQIKILELAKMPLPMTAVNGNSAHPDGQIDDRSTENLAKKSALLEFVQDTHAKFVKALVIAAWSRNAATVSKLIDVMSFMTLKLGFYEAALEKLINMKRDLTYARIPCPDLQTALQVLSTGEASWIPDFGYIAPPPLSAREQMKWVNELNTLLSIRLNVEDHDKIPYYFRNYSIESGRVTFRVEGEFEVDLTIADDDFEKQYWFIDFRFLFTPAPTGLTDVVRFEIEALVNEALRNEGLQGCYNVLHEFVLTHKITEYVRQAFEMARGLWSDTLKVERLNRAMSIQYWTNRLPSEGPNSWIILGVHSGKVPGVVPHPKHKSHLTLRWFRDGKEVKDADVPVDDAEISTEALLRRVIARHTEHILSGLHGKLRNKTRYLKRESSLGLTVSLDDPAESALKMQLTRNELLTLRIVPMTGLCSMAPQTAIVGEYEALLNKTKNLVEEGINPLEKLRCRCIVSEIMRRGISTGWTGVKGPVRPDDVKPLLQTKDPFQSAWFQRRGWPSQWYLMLSLSGSGDRWWLVEVSNSSKVPRISTYTQVLLSPGIPDFTDQFFWNLTHLSAAMISHVVDLKTLHEKKIKHAIANPRNCALAPHMKLPAVFMRLSDVVKLRPSARSMRISSWATDFVQIVFKGVERPSRTRKPISPVKGSPDAEEQKPDPSVLDMDRESLVTLVEARFQVADRARFSLLRGNVERDVAFNPRLGVFALRLKAQVGTTIMETLGHRLQAIERLVDCVDAIARSRSDIKCEIITLARVVFSYSDAIGRTVASSADAGSEADVQRWKATLDLRNDRINMTLDGGNPHLRVLDAFDNLINSELGFKKVPQYLAFTLPVLRALDNIEAKWRAADMNYHGRFEVFHEHLDWFNVRYTLLGADKGRPRQMTMRIKLRERKGQPWWMVAQAEPKPEAGAPGEFQTALAKVWGMDHGGRWKSFKEGAACQANDNFGLLMGSIDDAIREVAKKTPSPTMTRQTPAKAQPPAKNRPINLKLPEAAVNRNRAQQPPPKSNVVVLDD